VDGAGERRDLAQHGRRRHVPALGGHLVEDVERRRRAAEQVGQRVEVRGRADLAQHPGQVRLAGQVADGLVDGGCGLLGGEQVDLRGVHERPCVPRRGAHQVGDVGQQRQRSADRGERLGRGGGHERGGDRQARDAVPPGQRRRPCRVVRQPGGVLRVQPLGVAGQGAAGRAEVVGVGGQALGVDGDRVLQCGLHLGAHSCGLGALVVQVEHEGAHADGLEPPRDDVQGRALLGDEQHLLSVGDRAGEQVGDRLRLAGAGRALEDEGAAGGGLGDRAQLRGVGGHRARGGQLVEVGGVRGVGDRVDERLRGPVHEVVHQRVGGEVGPVLVEVLPEPVLGELQDGEVGGGLDPVRQPGVGQRLAHRLQRPVQVDARALLAGLGQPRDGEAVHLPQLLQQAVVRGARPGVVERQPVDAVAAGRGEGDRHQHQRGAQRPAVELPHQAAEGQVQVVGAGLLAHRLGLVGQVAQPRQIAALTDLDVHRAALDEHLGQLRVGQVARGGQAALAVHGGDPVVGQQLDGGAAVQQVLQHGQVGRRHGQRQAGPLAVVDQPVAQREVQQAVLPLLHAGGDLGAARHRGHRRPLDRPGRDAVHRRPVLDDLHRAVPAAGAGRQRHDAVAPGAVDVGDAEDPVEVAGAGQPGAVGGGVQVGAGRAAAGEQRGLDQPDQPEVDEVDQRRDVGGGDALGAALLAPVAEEGVSCPHLPADALRHPQQRPDAGLLQRGGQRDDGVQAGADPPVEDVAGGAHLLPDVGPGGRGLGVADGAALHRLGERGDDLVDPLRAGLVTLHRPAAGARLEQVGGLADERGHRRVVGQHVRREHLQRQRHGGGQPLVGRQHLHRDGGAADVLAVHEQVDLDGAGPLLLDLQHRGGVHDQADVAEHRGLAGVEVDEQLDGAADRALGVAHAQPHGRAVHRAAVVGERQAGDDRDAVVGQRVAEHRRRGHLDRDGRPGAGAGGPDVRGAHGVLSTGPDGTVPSGRRGVWDGCDGCAATEEGPSCPPSLASSRRDPAAGPVGCPCGGSRRRGRVPRTAGRVALPRGLCGAAVRDRLLGAGARARRPSRRHPGARKA
jgi:hypothetical protein